MDDLNNVTETIKPVIQYDVNDIRVLAIEDGPLRLSIDIFPDIEEHPEKHSLVREDGVIPSITRVFLVNIGSRVVLIDAGWGRESATKGFALERLNDAGVQADDVTDILITHMDVDHISGLIYKNSPVYRNAALHIIEKEYDSWVTLGAYREPEYIALSRKVAEIYRDRIAFTHHGEEVLPGIHVEAACGHTPGHAAYTVFSGDNKMTIYGDMIHAAPLQLVYPLYCSIHDLIPEQAGESRLRLLHDASLDGRIFAGMHIQEIGLIEASPEGGYKITPIKQT